MYNGIVLNHKKNENFSICSNTDGLGEHYAKWNKSDRKYTAWYHSYVRAC